MLRPVPRRWAPLGAAALLASCAFNVEEPEDASFPDLAPRAPDTGPRPPPDGGVRDLECPGFCGLLSDCQLAATRAQLSAYGGELRCVTEAPGFEGCVSVCEAEAPSGPCLRCLSPCGGSNCDPLCGSSRPTEGRASLVSNQSCWFGGARPSVACSARSSEPSASGSLRPDGPLGPHAPIDYVGTASVVSLDPLRLRRPDGELLVVEAEVSGFAALAPGEGVRLEARAECPWGCRSAFVLRTAAGALIAAGWSGREPLALPELALRYEPAACVGVPWESSRAIDLTLVAGEDPVPLRSELEVGGLRVANGQSVLHYAIVATDHPTVWLEGLIEPVR